MQQQINSEEIFSQAEDIFLELAFENLNQASFKFLQENIDKLEIEIKDEFDESWQELIFELPDEEEFVEVEFSLRLDQKVKAVAVMLLSICNDQNFDEKQCHIQWFEL